MRIRMRALPILMAKTKLLNHGMGSCDILPAEHGRLFIFQIFVNIEKVNDLFENMRGQVG